MSLTVLSKSLTMVMPCHPTGKPSGGVSARLDAAGGVGAVTWQPTSGIMPPGLTLGPDGVVRGTPQGRGSSLIYVRATDSDMVPNFADAPITVVVQ